MTTRLYDEKWQHEFLGADARWNLMVLHGLYRPVSCPEWATLVEARNSGVSVEDAVAQFNAEQLVAA